MRPLKTPLLMVATTTHWLGAARMPRPLADAGFEVSVLAPRNSLIEKSRFVTRIGLLQDSATPLQWADAFAAMVQATAPRLVVPCDDTAFWLLQMFATSPPDGLRHASQIQALIEDSLGDPAWYKPSVDKTLLPKAAQALGVRVPPFTVTGERETAREFAATHGYADRAEAEFVQRWRGGPGLLSSGRTRCRIQPTPPASADGPRPTESEAPRAGLRSGPQHELPHDDVEGQSTHRIRRRKGRAESTHRTLHDPAVPFLRRYRRHRSQACTRLWHQWLFGSRMHGGRAHGCGLPARAEPQDSPQPSSGQYVRCRPLCRHSTPR